MDDAKNTLVQDSFAKVVPIRDTAAMIFYADLFETAPHVEPYFADADMSKQGAKLMTTLGIVVNGLRDLGKVVPTAQELARKHVGYGVTPEDYDAVGASLIRTLEKGLGEDFTPETRAAWSETYATLATVMKDAAYPPTGAGTGGGAPARKPFWKFRA